jgi:hypothetical protein
VIGGPCGKPMCVPNSKVQRGWSMVGIKWRFETGEQLPPVIPCRYEIYVLREDAKGKPIYVHEPNVERDNLIRMALGWPLR